jgi:hypothetical protein
MDLFAADADNVQDLSPHSEVASGWKTRRVFASSFVQRPLLFQAVSHQRSWTFSHGTTATPR